MNTARGAIVDRDSLVKVMKDGHLAGKRAHSIAWLACLCASAAIQIEWLLEDPTSC